MVLKAVRNNYHEKRKQSLLLSTMSKLKSKKS